MSTLFGVAQMANAEPEKPQYRLIQLQAEASREVANDQMRAILFTELNNNNPASLAQDINRVINEAMRQATRYPQVKVSTGRQNTYPVYDDKNKLKGWRARAQVELKSTDFKAASDLVAALQSNMQIESIDFSVSDAERRKVENELMVEASQAFQQRAQLLQQSWQASGYELVSLDLNTSNYERPPIMYAAMKASDARMNIESQNVQGGNSQIRVNASGSVQLR
ncbi:SIMPL domain-containing protein [Alkanindiges sp. WGS2144]|uniref:SIMPL domain-containing protein n=1 Tax=Alkanindiges sp. WGS2144 TaxID=3366808 RepID=UPI003751D8AC